MTRDGFGGRLAYLRWLERRVLPESDADFAARAGVGYGWLKKWMIREDAPRDRHLTPLLVAALGADSKWLLDGEGDAPDPSAWRRWMSAPGEVRAKHVDPDTVKEFAPGKAKKRASK